MLTYSNFGSGLEKVIADIIKSNAKVKSILSGALVYETNKFDAVKSIPCFNNHFSVIYSKKGNFSIDKCILDIVKNCAKFNFIENKKSRTFRVVISDQNNLVAVDEKLKRSLENNIAKNTNLKVKRSGADEEFWVLKRSENVYFFMQRLTTHAHKSYEKILQKGELKPEITYIMNYLSNPTKEDTYLDPFSGSGSLGLCRLEKYGNCNKIYMTDIDFEKTKQLKSKVGKKQKVFYVNNVDVREIHTKISYNNINKVVTDPPWGYFENIDNMEEFYDNFLNEMKVITTNNALFVVLTSRESEFKNVLVKNNVEDLEQIEILLSGKKATINKFTLPR